MGQPHSGPLLPLVFCREVFLVHYPLQFLLMIYHMHPTCERLQLLFTQMTQMTQKCLTALVWESIAWCYRPLFQIWNTGVKGTTFASNASKCKVLNVMRKKGPLCYCNNLDGLCYCYSLDGIRLKQDTEEKNLAVTVTSSLSWDTHIHNTVSKANKILELLKRTCPLLMDVSVRSMLYLSLVKSQLSYETQVWSPNQNSLKVMIKQATSFISHGRIRQRNSFNLKTPLCRTSTFKASYFNHNYY